MRSSVRRGTPVVAGTSSSSSGGSKATLERSWLAHPCAPALRFYLGARDAEKERVVAGGIPVWGKRKAGGKRKKKDRAPSPPPAARAARVISPAAAARVITAATAAGRSRARVR